MKSNKLPSNDLKETTLTSSCLHQGKSFSFWRDEVVFPNGEKGYRDYVKYPDAVAILPILDDKILFIKQYRYAPGKILLEIPAGKIDSGETPMETVRRELREETGYDSHDLEYLLSYYSCPGYSTEKIHTYVARNLFPAPLEADEDEFILTETLSLSEAKEAIRTGQIEDSKTILAILAYETQTKREAKP
ncbi:NUDIX hydrolase [Thermospira aquatica]|uniref:GDP-mannose pyrophosphatase n=1 Tax=Thermospira aquatica TaxID=2828656 RepID=A0AAX3BC68_9SPIR|nr:NUDIX hydrolase [Thermospira aquatica]URA09693.1 NUDIX hydrolase [Thermospira aquatica]